MAAKRLILKSGKAGQIVLSVCDGFLGMGMPDGFSYTFTPAEVKKIKKLLK
jgi:hypothetical protein